MKCKVHKKVGLSGKKFVYFDDEILLDKICEMWYNGNFGPSRARPGR